MPFVVGKVLTCEPVAGKDKLKQCTVDIGTEVVTIVSNAPNVRVGTRTCVATLGTEVEFEGTPMEIKPTNVGGVISNGMLCDSVMLNWAGGAAGLCVQVPETCALGSPAPTSKPRMGGEAATETVPEISAKDLKAQEKAARKAANAEKKAARKAAKEGGKGGTDDAVAGVEGDDEDDEEEKVKS